MNTIEFNATSWHGRLYYKYHLEAFNPDRNTNICAYIRGVLRGAFFAASLATVIGFYLGSWFHVILAIVKSVQFGTSFVEELPLLYSVLPILTLAMFMFVLLVMIANQFEDWVESKNSSGVKNSFITEAYRSLKDKVCFKVNVV